MKHKAFCIVAVLFVVAGVVTWRWSSLFMQSEAANKALVADARCLSFGEVWEEKSLRWHLPITNTLEKPIEVGQFASSCTCLVIEPKAAIIPPGATVDLRLELDLMPRTAQDASRANRDFQSQVLALGSKPVPIRFNWMITGRVRSALQLDAVAIDFGETALVRGEQFKPKSLRMRARTPLQTVKASCAETYAMVSVSSIPDEPDEFLLRVTPSPTIATGPFGFDVDLCPIQNDGRQLPALSVRVTGAVQDDIQVQPATVVIGARPIGEEITRDLLLQSVSGKPFVIKRIVPDGDGLNVAPAAVIGSDNHNLRLRQKVSKQGNQTGTIKIVAMSSENIPCDLTVKVSYFGLSLGSN